MDDAQLFASILFAALSAGLLFGWAVSVIPGLKRLDDKAYIGTMQQINVAIINGLFLIIFIGAPVILIGGAYTNESGWLWAATGVYLVGVLGVTAVGNVPLNNTLDRFDLTTADDASAAEQRRNFEVPWVRWHYVRTVSGIAALALAIGAAVA